MRILKTLMMLMAAGGILTANVASAALPCKCDMPTVSAEQHADAKAAMPCHDMAAKKDTAEKTSHCHGCKCLHGAAAMILPVTVATPAAIATFVPVFAAHAMRAHAPEAMFQPPRSLS